jgi:hypothetical protein
MTPSQNTLQKPQKIFIKTSYNPQKTLKNPQKPYKTSKNNKKSKKCTKNRLKTYKTKIYKNPT